MIWTLHYFSVIVELKTNNILRLHSSLLVSNVLSTSAVRIVFFSFRIECWTIIRNFESNLIVFAVLKVRMLNSFFLKCELQLLKFELNSKFVCILDPEEREINFVHYFLPLVCNGPPKLRYWGCQSVTMAMCGCSWAEVVFLTCVALTRQHVACASESDSITLAGPVSPHTVNAKRLRVKVEPITILTESPALNWPCAVLASHRYNAIRCHSRDWRWEHAWELPHAAVVRQLPCGGQGSGRGRNTCGAVLGEKWVQWLVAGKVQTNRFSVIWLITVK